MFIDLLLLLTLILVNGVFAMSELAIVSARPIRSGVPSAAVNCQPSDPYPHLARAAPARRRPLRSMITRGELR